MTRPDPICPRCDMPHESGEPCWALGVDHDDSWMETTLDEKLRIADERGDKELDSWKSDN